MNRQEIFDKVAVHLIEQGTKAMNRSSCAYEDNKGNRCAIGCLIPDGHEALDHDGGVYCLLDKYNDLVKLWNVNITDSYLHSDLKFLSDLQDIHDEISSLYWDVALNDFADTNYLSITSFMKFLNNRNS